MLFFSAFYSKIWKFPFSNFNELKTDLSEYIHGNNGEREEPHFRFLQTKENRVQPNGYKKKSIPTNIEVFFKNVGTDSYLVYRNKRFEYQDKMPDND